MRTNLIQILPAHITDKIAAGEVIERPSSIVKELLENSIDAMGTRITVSVKNGGKSYIKISDNGIGMIHDDLILSFERHATSKISTVNDLTTIETFGFRGEALSSIASIAKLVVISKTETDEVGTRICIEGGKIKDVRQVAASTGTSVEVNQVFFNTPARKKFLKGDTTEMMYVSQIFHTLSLAKPDIHFRLVNFDKDIINSSSTDDLKNRVGDLFGKDIVKNLIPISAGANEMKLSGYISKPSFGRSDRQNQFFYVNNRCIKDKIVNHAIYDAYRTLLPKNRHPVLFLFLDIPTMLVDINVHPSKAEVRFGNQRLVHDLIFYSIKKCLMQFKDCSDDDIFQFKKADQEIKYNTQKAGGEEYSNKSFNKVILNSFQPNEPEKWPIPGPQSEKGVDFNLPSPTTQKYPVFANCRPVGQIENSFIVLENSSSMILVDQHTAHERVLFEKLEREFQESKIEKQQLLFPVTMELSYSESILLQNHIEEIGKLGLEIECFGKNTFLIRSVPSILEGKDYSALILEIVDVLSKYEKLGSFEQIFSETLKLLACHGAIRAHHHLEPEEIRNLLLDLEKTKLPYTCPHGRPISLVFSLRDIKKKFLRI